MAEHITTQFEIVGDAQYKKALDEINSSLKVSYSSMSLVEARYDSAGDSQEALRAKTNALQQAIQAQASKVALLTAQVAKSTEKTGENSQETAGYQIALNKASTELTKMQNQMGKYQEAMHGSAKSTVSVKDAVDGLTNALGINVPPAMQGMIDKLDGVSASGAAAATVVIGLGTALGKLTEDQSKSADELLTLSSQTGLTTDQLQEFNYASELVDVSTDTLQGSLKKLTKNMDSARGGSGDAAEAFKALGIKVTDSHGQLKSANDVFLQTIDALGKVKNGTEADALSMAIFGKSATDLNPLIDAGSDKLSDLADEAHNVGYVIDNETLQSFGALDDANKQWEKKVDAIKAKLAEGMLPVLTGITDALNAIPTPVLTGITVAMGVVTVATLIAKAVRDAAMANALLAASNTAVGATGLAAGAGLSAMLPALLIIGAIALGAGAIAAIVTAANDKAKSSAKTATQAASQQSYAHNARGSRYWQGGQTLVGEDGPEIVDLPRGSRIYPNGQSPQSNSSVTNYYQVTIPVNRIKELNDIVEIAQNEATSIRQGVTT